MSVITVRITEPASAGQIARFYNTLLGSVEHAVSGGPDIEVHAEAFLADDEPRGVTATSGEEVLAPDQLRAFRKALATAMSPASEVPAA